MADRLTYFLERLWDASPWSGSKIGILAVVIFVVAVGAVAGLLVLGDWLRSRLLAGRLALEGIRQTWSWRDGPVVAGSLRGARVAIGRWCLSIAVPAPSWGKGLAIASRPGNDTDLAEVRARRSGPAYSLPGEPIILRGNAAAGVAALDAETLRELEGYVMRPRGSARDASPRELKMEVHGANLVIRIVAPQEASEVLMLAEIVERVSRRSDLLEALRSRATGHPRERYRALALAGLVRLAPEDPASLAAAQACAGDSSPEVRAWASLLAGVPPDAVGTLVWTAEMPDAVAIGLSRDLAGVGPRAEPLLRELLRHPFEDVVEVAADGLGSVGSSVSVAALTRLLTPRFSARVQRAAHRALSAIRARMPDLDHALSVAAQPESAGELSPADQAGGEVSTSERVAPGPMTTR